MDYHYSLHDSPEERSSRLLSSRRTGPLVRLTVALIRKISASGLLLINFQMFLHLNEILLSKEPQYESLTHPTCGWTNVLSTNLSTINIRHLKVPRHCTRKAAHCLGFNLKAPCVLYIGQAFRYFPENAFYIFNQQIYFIIWYLLDRASLI